MAGTNKREKLQSVNAHRRNSSTGNSLIDEIVNNEPVKQEEVVKNETEKEIPDEHEKVKKTEASEMSSDVSKVNEIPSMPAAPKQGQSIADLIANNKVNKDDSRAVNVSVTLSENERDELESFADISIQANLSLEGCNGRISRSGIVQAALKNYIQRYYSMYPDFEDAVKADVEEKKKKKYS